MIDHQRIRLQAVPKVGYKSYAETCHDQTSQTGTEKALFEARVRRLRDREGTQTASWAPKQGRLD